MNNNLPLSSEEIRQEEVSLIHPLLNLEIDDRTLVNLIDKRIRDDDAFYEKQLNLQKRRKRNRDFWLGKQIDLESLDDNFQIPYIDNIIWQDLETRAGIAAARLPEIIAIAPADNLEARMRAKKVEDGLTIRILNDDIRRLIRDGIRHNHLDFIGVIKCYWNLDRGKNGDFVFALISPDKIGMDHTATIPHDGYTADNMEIIYEWIEAPTGRVLATFSNKREELKQKLGIVKETSRQMAAKIKYLEVWFSWYDNQGKKQEGVCWKYQDLILGKSKNPYYDWEGIDQKTEELDEFGLPLYEKKLQNYFEQPRKPYIFLSYQNLGNSPMDDTSAVEQAIPLQQNINKRGRQITEISDNAVPKKVFNGNFITKDEARRVSNDPAEHIWLEGDGLEDVNRAFGTVRSEQPSPILYNDLVANRAQIDSKFATHSVTRGELTPQTSGISKQITREGDLMISDDLVETMIVRAISEMAGWALQMMKSQYHKPHILRLAGKDGEMTTLTLAQDDIDDGLSLKVKASTIDKVRRQGEALQLAASQNIDPLTLFEDMDVPNPKERAQRLIAFKNGQIDGYARYEQLIGTGVKNIPSLPAPEAGSSQPSV